MGIISSYRLRLKRKRLRLRAFRKRHELKCVADRTRNIRPGHVLLFCTQRNEGIRLAYFLDYYRKLGVDHFFFVDNDSSDGSYDFLAKQADVSLWHTKARYRRARYGVDWLNWLQRRYADGHWTLTVDADEFLVYPFHDTRTLKALTDWLDASSIKSFSAMLLDMYPKGRLGDEPYQSGQNPFEIACWFDSGNYTILRNAQFSNLWIQGGPRARVFFSGRPKKAPALNKVPLVKWDRRYTYVTSTHMLLPRGLNRVYDTGGGEKASGVLLHAKFLDTFGAKAAEELARSEHYAKSVEYKAYAEQLESEPEIWCEASTRYDGWRQLDRLGLMSKGNWA